MPTHVKHLHVSPGAHQTPLNEESLGFSLSISAPHRYYVPGGVQGFSGKPGNAFFHFYYHIPAHARGELRFEVSLAQGVPLYVLEVPPAYTEPGHYKLCWDGHDQQGIFDSQLLLQPLKATLLLRTQQGTQSQSLHFQCHHDEADWIAIRIDTSLRRIDAVLKTAFRDGGANTTAARTRSYEELLQLAIEGLSYHYGRNLHHAVAKSVMLGEQAYQFYLQAVNDPESGLPSPKIVYQSNARARRSRNWELSRILFYNTGALQHRKQWYHKRSEKADADFKQIAAHEIGHELLLAYGGHWHSKSHKGSSTVLTQKPLGNYSYPPQGEIDLMIYYQERQGAPHPRDYNQRCAASEADVLSLLWLCKLRIVPLKG